MSAVLLTPPASQHSQDFLPQQIASASLSHPGFWEGDVQQRAMPLHNGKQSGHWYFILTDSFKFYKLLIPELPYLATFIPDFSFPCYGGTKLVCH